MAKTPAIYGLMAEFEEPTALVAATAQARREGYQCMDAYSPSDRKTARGARLASYAVPLIR